MAKNFDPILLVSIREKLTKLFRRLFNGCLTWLNDLEMLGTKRHGNAPKTKETL